MFAISFGKFSGVAQGIFYARKISHNPNIETGFHGLRCALKELAASINTVSQGIFDQRIFLPFKDAFCLNSWEQRSHENPFTFVWTTEWIFRSDWHLNFFPQTSHLTFLEIYVWPECFARWNWSPEKEEYFWPQTEHKKPVCSRLWTIFCGGFFY